MYTEQVGYSVISETFEGNLEEGYACQNTVYSVVELRFTHRTLQLVADSFLVPQFTKIADVLLLQH